MFPLSRVIARQDVSKRCIAKVTHAEREASLPSSVSDVAYEQARPFKEIPKVSTIKTLYQLSLTEKKTKINEVSFEKGDF